MAKTTAEATETEWRARYDAADELKALAPWEWMRDSDLFAVRDLCEQMEGAPREIRLRDEALAALLGYFGPTGVLREAQGNGVGKALLITSLLAMWDEGYGYAIIGWPARSAMGFYTKTVQAQIIEDSSPGIYRRLVDA